jgi:hypothetical protein
MGMGSIDSQIPLAGDFGIFEMYLLEGEEEGRKEDDWSL